MDKTSVLNEIKAELEGLLHQTQKMAEETRPLHPLDKDLLLAKTRRLYEKIMALEKTGIPENQPVPAPHTPAEETPVFQNGENKQPEQNPAATASPVTSEKIQQPIPEEKTVPEEKIMEPENLSPEGEPITEEKPAAQPENGKTVLSIKEKQKEPEKPAPQPVETTLDLFSSSPQQSIGEVLKPSEKQALAETLQTAPLKDIREAIGINDKFTFVNDLFNGDLERYNKVMDELNGFSGLSGAQTYLAELQVQYQWDEESPAYRKLALLLERKFS